MASVQYLLSARHVYGNVLCVGGSLFPCGDMFMQNTVWWIFLPWYSLQVQLCFLVSCFRLLRRLKSAFNWLWSLELSLLSPNERLHTLEEAKKRV